MTAPASVESSFCMRLWDLAGSGAGKSCMDASLSISAVKPITRFGNSVISHMQNSYSASACESTWKQDLTAKHVIGAAEHTPQNSFSKLVIVS
jgi:hypothetical protein